MVSVCNTTIKGIMSNFIPCEAIICDDRDLFMDWQENKKIHEENNLYKNYLKNNDTKMFEKLTLLPKQLHPDMVESKNDYYSNYSTKLVKAKIWP